MADTDEYGTSGFSAQGEDKQPRSAGVQGTAHAPGVDRKYAKTRLRRLAPWVQKWQLEGMFAGVEGKRAADAMYNTARRVELCTFLGEEFAGAAADIYKCFDQI